jgi:hypothetical protein
MGSLMDLHMCSRAVDLYAHLPLPTERKLRQIEHTPSSTRLHVHSAHTVEQVQQLCA